ncbi:MAG: hypothetical protein U1V55_07630 [Planktothrix rubescens PR222]
MKNTNTISFYIGVIFGAGLTFVFLTFPPATSQPTPTPTPTPTEQPEKWP